MRRREREPREDAVHRALLREGARAAGERLLREPRRDPLRVGARGARLLEDEVLVQEPLRRLHPLRLRVPRERVLVAERVREEVEQHLLRDRARDPDARLGAARAGDAPVAAALLRVHRDEERRLAHDARGVEPRAAAAGEDDLVRARGAPARDAIRVGGERRHQERLLELQRPPRRRFAAGAALGVERASGSRSRPGRRRPRRELPRDARELPPAPLHRLGRAGRHAHPPQPLGGEPRARRLLEHLRELEQIGRAGRRERAPLERAPVAQVALAEQRREQRALLRGAARGRLRDEAARARVGRDAQDAPADVGERARPA